MPVGGGRERPRQDVLDLVEIEHDRRTFLLGEVLTELARPERDAFVVVVEPSLLGTSQSAYAL